MEVHLGALPADLLLLAQSIRADVAEGGVWNGNRVQEWVKTTLQKDLYLSRCYELLDAVGYSQQVPRPRHVEADQERGCISLSWTLSRTRNPQPDQSLRTRANLTLTLAGQAFARGDLDLGQELAELANAESFKHPTQLNPQWTAYRDQKLVTLPAALRHISGAPPAALRAPEPIAIQRPKLLPNYQPLPDHLLAFIRAHPEAVLARCQQKTRAVVEQAMQESSPVAAGVIQLLQSIVQELSNT